MDPSSPAHPLPRLRVSRDRANPAPAPASFSAASRLPDFSQLLDLRLSDMHPSDEDEDQDQYPTPKMNTAAPLTPASATPTPSVAGRLRELIQLVPNGSSASQPAPHSQRPSSPAFHESDFESELSDAGHSHARESLRDIFTKALREPGDTPQKGRPRKYTDDTSSRGDPDDWSDAKGKRTNLGKDASTSRSMPRSLTSSHLTALRPSRDASAVDFPLKSISAEDSDDTEDFSQARRRTNPSNTAMTSQSLHISQNSGFPQQSNLLDQDSEMQRAFGALESFDEPSTHSQKFRGMNNNASTASTASTTPGPSGKQVAEKSRHSSKSLESTTPTDRGRRRSSLSKTVTPPLRHKTSLSNQFSDQSSSMSVSDYTERVKEMEREKNREREREWNKRLPKLTRPGSSVSPQSPWPEQRPRTSSISSIESARSGSPHSTVSNDSPGNHRARVRTISGLYDRPRVVSTGNRPGSMLSNHSTSHMEPSQGLRRHHSLTIGAESPDSKSSGTEVVHERERNWNAPRPKWPRRTLPDTPDRPISPTHKQSPRSQRNEPVASSSTPKDSPHISRSDMKSPTTKRQSHAKSVPLSPSPAEKRSSTPISIGKASPFSKSPGTPSRLKSQIPRPVSPGRQRLLLSSNSRDVEKPRNVSDIQEQSGDENMEQAKSMVSFPSAANGPSLSQESMELTQAYNVHEASSALPSFSDDGHRTSFLNSNVVHAKSLSRFEGFEGSRDELLDEDNGAAQDRTPTLQVLDTLSEETSAQEHVSAVNESYENFISTNEPHISFPSVLSTPPRSHNDSKPQFETPPPPKGLPDLPGPPSSPSVDENQESLPEFFISPTPADVTPPDGMEGRLVNGSTTFKTPKPPGGWLTTPGPFTREQFTLKGSVNGFVESSDDGALPLKSNYSRATAGRTPMPPGGWMNTPAPRMADSDAESVINEGGLTTPVGSIGRASNFPLKTPAPPGAWALTPATTRKGALKVRFDPDATNEFNSILPDSSRQTTNPMAVSEIGARSSTPEPITPITPPSRSPRKHKRSPSVRLVDAFGNENRDERLRRRTSPSPTPSSMRSQSGIRIVDALGQEVQGEETVSEANEEGPLSRVEALQRVKLGIQELAEGIESLDMTNALQENDIARLKELDDASQALKQSRKQLKQNIQKSEKELRLRVRQKILRGDWLGRNAWFLFVVAIVQIALVFMMYRASTLRARKQFLTNYYDPFNPDLFLYTTNPDTQYATPTAPWSLFVEAVRSGDLTAFTGACRTGLSILIKRLHREIWDVWGDDPNRPVGAWPPT